MRRRWKELSAVNALLTTMCINLWNRCGFIVNHLEAQKDIPLLSTFSPHIKTFLFQSVMLVFHNKQKGYSSKLFSEENSAQYSRKPFTHFTKDKWRAVDKNKVAKPDLQSGLAQDYTARYLPKVNGLRLVHNLMNRLFIAVDEFRHPQKPSFHSHFYPRFIHMCLYFDFNRLAVL